MSGGLPISNAKKAPGVHLRDLWHKMVSRAKKYRDDRSRTGGGPRPRFHQRHEMVMEVLPKPACMGFLGQDSEGGNLIALLTNTEDFDNMEEQYQTTRQHQQQQQLQQQHQTQQQQQQHQTQHHTQQQHQSLQTQQQQVQPLQEHHQQDRRQKPQHSNLRQVRKRKADYQWELLECEKEKLGVMRQRLEVEREKVQLLKQIFNKLSGNVSENES
ncbi:G-box-binding factor-like [Lytechinus pictus]|uniref:G-box-binding factor-like n=1 Tax=Lytechinus pictus TaxID=7653 RepID=UPI0030BA258F